MRIKIQLTIILSLLVGQSYACKCDGTGTVKSSFNTSDIVVSGQVLTRELVSYSQTLNPDSVSSIKSRLKNDKKKNQLFEMNYIFKIEFEITEKYKGITTRDTLTIYTAMNGASCGYKFEVGKSYIVYASKRSYLKSMFLDKSDRDKDTERKNTYWTSICTRTTEFNSTEATELKALKKD